MFRDRTEPTLFWAGTVPETAPVWSLVASVMSLSCSEWLSTLLLLLLQRHHPPAGRYTQRHCSTVGRINCTVSVAVNLDMWFIHYSFISCSISYFRIKFTLRNVVDSCDKHQTGLLIIILIINVRQYLRRGRSNTDSVQALQGASCTPTVHCQSVCPVSCPSPLSTRRSGRNHQTPPRAAAVVH